MNGKMRFVRVFPFLFCAVAFACVVAPREPDPVLLLAPPQPTASAANGLVIAVAAPKCAPSHIVCSQQGCLYASTDWLAESPSAQALACSRGHRAACTSLGARTSLGEGVTRDDAKALELLDGACGMKDMLACVDAEKLHANTGFERWVSWCNAGIGEACLEAGNEIRFGSAASAHSPAEGAAYYVRACDMGIGNGCARLAYHYGTGLAVPRDDAKMATLFERACSCADDTGCSGVGYAYLEGRGVAVDYTRARQTFTALCDRKIEASCVHLGRMYEQGFGTPVDLARARTIYEAACADMARDPEGSQACYMLGHMYRDGRGVAADEHRAFQLFDDACRAQQSTACGELGRWYRNGRYVPRDTTRALELFDFACAHGDEGGCKDADALRANP